MNKISIVLADNDEYYMSTVEESIKQHSDIEIIGKTNNGLKATKLLDDLHPDVMILDLLLPGADGLSILENTINKHKGTKFIVLTKVNSAPITQAVFDLGVSYYLLKPVDLNILSQRIRFVHEVSERSVTYTMPLPDTNTAPASLDLQKEITDILHRIGVPAHLKGYRYLQTAIEMCVHNSGVLDAVTKSLYPEIAKEFFTTASRVERAIRHAIEVCWQRKIRDNNLAFEEYFLSTSIKPTNSEFIASLTTKLQM